MALDYYADKKAEKLVQAYLKEKQFTIEKGFNYAFTPVGYRKKEFPGYPVYPSGEES